MPLREAIAAFLIAALGGCGGGVATPTGDTLPPPPDARMTGLGMRIQTLLVDDIDGYDVGRALAKAGAVERPAPAAGERSTPESRLARAGIRAVRIPAAAFSAFTRDLALIGDAGDRWIGPSPDWTLILSGNPWNFSQQVALHDGPMTVPPGYARLLVRAWTTTGPITEGAPPATTIRADIVPQLVEVRAQSPFAELLDPKSRREQLAQGQWLESLALETEIAADQILLLVPETPGVDWSKLPQFSPAEHIHKTPDTPPPPAEPVDQPLDRPIIFEVPSAADTAPESLIPTLGDALLTDSSALSRRSRKAIVVFLPALGQPAPTQKQPG